MFTEQESKELYTLILQIKNDSYFEGLYRGLFTKELGKNDALAIEFKNKQLASQESATTAAKRMLEILDPMMQD